MNKLLFTAVAIGLVFTAASATAICGKSHPHAAQPTAALPPDAVPGECYARVIKPAEYREVIDTVVRREATEDVRIIPARYETVSEQVVVKPATTKTIDVPAVYKTVSHEVEVEPARSEWRQGKCNPKAIVDHATGECWCLVAIPAVMKTVYEQVVDIPATTRVENVPAVYETVSKRVEVEPAREERIPIPAIIENVSRRELVVPESVSWVKIPCEPGDEHTSNTMWSFPRLDNRIH